MDYQAIPAERFKSLYKIVKAEGTQILPVRNISAPMPSNSQVNQGGMQRIVNFFAVNPTNAKLAFDNRDENGDFEVGTFNNWHLLYKIQIHYMPNLTLF